jgi:polyisoprenoid-binding protein YceI
MKSNSIVILFIAASFLFLSYPVHAQNKFKVGPAPELKVVGTSTLHDWEMVSSEATGEGILVIQDGKLQQVQGLKVSMPAESIKSGKKAMDKNTYAALNTKKHSDVKFELSDISKAGADTWTAKGNFTIAGVTKPVSFEVKGTQVGENYRFEGAYPFKLTDYSIDPPTALLGTVKTGNEVSIHFNIHLQPAP